MDKKAFRKYCLKKLKNIPKDRKYILDHLARKNLKKIIKKLKPKKILAFYPLELEVDILPLLKELRKNTQIYLPFIEDASFKMVKYRLPLKKNSFNVYEPKNSFLKIKDIDMMIVPIVGVDRNFKRVGFGKGMYDRFFEKLKKKPIVVFIQRAICFNKKNITDRYDIPADFYITPK